MEIMLGDAQIERHILYVIMTNNKLLRVVRGQIQPEVFFYDQNRLIYEAICEIDNEGKTFDVLTVRSRMSKNGSKIDMAELMILASSDYATIDSFSVTRIEEACSALNTLYIRREHLRFAMEVPHKIKQQSDYSERDIQADVRKHLQEIEQKTNEVRPMMPGEALIKIMAESKKMMSGESSLTLMTGYKEMDAVFKGWKGGELIYVAGRPGMGKTAFGVGVAYNLGKQGIPTLIVTYEMKELDIYGRMMSLNFDLTGSDIRSYSLSDTLQQQLETDDTFSKMPVYVLRVSNTDAQTLRQIVRNYVIKYGIKLVVVDYLQLIKNAKGLNGEEAVSEKSGSLKTMAMENDIPVVAFSQLSREVEKTENKRPKLEHLKGSGAIEADGDAVMLLYRPEYYGIHQIGSVDVTNQIKFIVAKFRDGKPMDITMTWNNGRIDAKDNLPF